MHWKHSLLTVVALLIFVFGAVQCNTQSAETVVTTVEVEKIVTVEVEKVVEKIVTVEVEKEVERVVTVEVEKEVEIAKADSGTLDMVRERGILNCGSSASSPVFGYLDPNTNAYAGFDIDFCRAIAAAVLGDANAVNILPVDSLDRFQILEAGEVDVLIRNTTWLFSRDSTLGVSFTAITFYDGQGVLVRADSGIETLDELAGSTICVQQGTTMAQNLIDMMKIRAIAYELLQLADAEAALLAYDEGQCNAYTNNKSALAMQRAELAASNSHIILPETLSKEPLGPLVRHGDDQWFDIVRWVAFGTFQAEELGVNSANVEQVAANSQTMVIRSLLGLEGELGQTLGLDNGFMINVIKQVGNYGEIYDRYLGPETPYNLDRGPNAQYYNGGLIYSPPFR